MSPTTRITFLLNEELISVRVPPAMVALDFLRKQRGLTGSKEGCKEGDCGACTVLVGEREGDGVNYRPMTSCLLPVGELHGKHLVSIEGLNMDKLSPVQSALVHCGGTQCGYCTPGFVVAMTAGLMDESIPLNQKGHSCATSGNLCRCTGYRSIKAAGEMVFKELGQKLADKPRLAALCQNSVLPPYFQNVSKLLESIPADREENESVTNKKSPILGGGTDLLVQQGETIPDQFPRLLNATAVRPVQDRESTICVDARITFEAFARDPIIQSSIPKIEEYSELIASWPVRTRATLAGNICNASPIADMTCLLLALEAELLIRGESGERIVPLKEFYRGYKKIDKQADEIVIEIQFPKPKESEHIHWEKVSKRKILDIATVNSAAKIEIENGLFIRANLALGGVAATPLLLSKTSLRLKDQAVSPESVLDALEFAQSEFEPISDVRGSASYKRLLARQLLASHFTTISPNSISEEALHATLR